MLLVLVFHFDLVAGSKAGFIGVDVFFVISGFLITSILKRQLDDGTFRIPAFYLGRVRRLAPALIAVLITVWIAGAVLLFPQDFVELSKQVLASQFYVANIYYWRSVNYFGLGGDDVFLLHTWSLAVEEQFYLLYPLMLMGVHRYARKYFWHAIALALAISFALNIAFVARKPEATFYLLPTRAWELLAGALIPLLASNWRRSRGVDEVLGLAGMALIVAGVVSYRPDFRFPGFFALLPVAGAACLLLCGTNRPTGVSRFLALTPIAYVGKISYPLYLVHWPINVFAHRSLGEEYTLAWRLSMFGLSFVLAAAVTHLIEDPIRHKRWLRLDKPLLGAYAAGLAMTVLLVFLVAGSDGIPQRFPAEVNRIASYVNDRSPPLTECEFHGQALEPIGSLCKIGASGKPPTWLVYGDSHAWAAHDAFSQWLAKKGVAGLFIYRHACPPLTGLHLFGDKGGCFGFNASVTDLLAAHPELGSVVLVSTWRQAAEGFLSTSSDRRLSTKESLALFDVRFSETVKGLHRLGKFVIVWEPVPGARGSVPLALASASLEHRPANIEIGRDQYRAENDFFFAALQKNRRFIDATFSPSEALCTSGRCAVTINGNPAYFDNSHVTLSSAPFWAEMMRRDEQQTKAARDEHQP